MTTPRVEIVQVTPELAAQWLETMGHDASGGHRVQRRERKRKTEEFAAAMSRGEWRLNFESIKFSVDPARFGDERQHLIDGQHRLRAIVMSGVTVPLVVGWGAPPRAEETVDTGTKRSVADMLVMNGKTDANNLAAALRWTFRYLRHRDMRPHRDKETVQQLLAFLEGHPGLEQAVSVSHRTDVAIFGAPRSLVAALYYLTGMINPADRDAFFEGVASGVGLERTDPRWVLRQWCMRSVQISTGRKRPRTWLIGAVMIKAWNAWREGRVIENLGFKAGGTGAEKFPELHGLDEALAAAEEQVEAA